MTTTPSTSMPPAPIPAMIPESVTSTNTNISAATEADGTHKEPNVDSNNAAKHDLALPAANDRETVPAGSSQTLSQPSAESSSNHSVSINKPNSEAGLNRESVDHGNSESRTQHGSKRSDGRPENRRPKENSSPSQDPQRNNHSSSTSNQQDRNAGHRDDRYRSRQLSSSKDHKDRTDASSRKPYQDNSDRAGGGGSRVSRDEVKDMDGRSRGQGQAQKGKDERHQSHPSRQNPNKEKLGRENQIKDRGAKEKNDSLRDDKGKAAGATAATSAPSRPDPLSLLSITGRIGSLTPQKAFFGTSRVVDDFEKLNKIGEGTYGVVYRAKDKRTNEIVALKRIRMERENDGLPISSLREIKLLKTLRHDNIVLVKEVAVGSDLDQIFLVMEYCEQDMAALMDNVKKPYTPAEVKCLMYQLLKGIEYCHDHYVIHRDLKLSNLLLNAQGILKIADFGLARSFGLPSRPMTPKVVTLWYRAPELLFGDLNYTTAVDMWSAGCIFGELMRHGPLLPGKAEKQQVDLIIELLGTPHEKIWQGFNHLPMASIKLPEQRFNNLKNRFPNITDAARSLLSGLLTYDPKKRLSVKQALAHPYFIEAPPAKHPSLLPTHPEIRNIASTRHEENLKLKRQPPGDDTESIGVNKKRIR
ncbi:Cyclin-dependent kinase 10 [Mortierella polycephala]|uniref:cyclin-dependent kinase n=1 Tax=Mortierella polycephala TaxID=41804 RepID=A0A9P6Q0B5_9FUNG|nr:Cyclin-dependent kinase 10 [Mortierella polycephala]